MLRHWAHKGKIAAACLPWRLGRRAGLWRGQGAPVQFVTETADWAIRWVGEHVRDEINLLTPGQVALTSQPGRIVNRVVHFGSPHLWLTWGGSMSRSNRFVTSFFHGRPQDGDDYARQIDLFLASVPRLSMVVTGAGLIERRLLDWGVPREKLVRIPIGVDTGRFVPPSSEQRTEARRRLGVPDGTVLIGSFQKDGNGWGDGAEPKLIKGPDVFVAALGRLKERGVPVMAMLTGPARGYVKAGLDRLGIPYAHVYTKDQVDLVECYHALDLYLVTSREEGGPMGLMESMATGVPVVSTRVGMSLDLVEDGASGALVEIDDVDAIAERALGLLHAPDLDEIKRRARVSVMQADWSVVGRGHWDKAYRPLLEQLSLSPR
jgi:glycosyltransferase involved in cell wall biosynthesis